MLSENSLLDISDQSVPAPTEDAPAPREEPVIEEPSIEQEDAPPPAPAKEKKAEDDLIEF